MKNDIVRYALCALLLTPCLLKAQVSITLSDNGQQSVKLKNPQPIVGKVFYKFTNLPDTTKRDSLTQEVFELDFANNASMFISYSSKERDSIMKKYFEEQMKNATTDANGNRQFNFNSDRSALNVPKNATFARDKFYTDAGNIGTSLHIMNIAMTVFLIKDTAEKINWQIEDSTKDIQGNLCQKAVGESHGRMYTAWFCSDIPYSFGPRRLSGLPGLILEAYDEKHEVNYTLDHIENVKDTGEVIGLPEDGIDATPKDYAKAQEAFEKNPQAFIQSHGAPQMQGKVTTDIKIVRGIAPKGWKRPVNNNPIDLK
ncbi:hypothetical protein A9P82_00305 [Arachidicoccus ginsenosidimutans]|uniref:GLPGLI family protein n=1 Tax=Arachidicoccus sp. BS20 TaxID=1850526 RepID=UPI0007F0C93B|nr:GLPGLI family protein [Arachidicoccus sp. BS20]ANI87898.1 hypothetical protein A9P82_00305 [Arachidicoccus sp. BS20]